MPARIAALVVLALSCNGVDRPVDPDYLVLRPVSNKNERIVDLRHFDVRTAAIEAGPMNSFVVTIRTTPEGKALLGRWTEANIGRQLGIFVGNQLIDAPYVRSRIDEMIVLEGGYTKAQAEEVLARLRRGGAAR